MLSKDLDLLKKLNLLDDCHSVFHDPSANEVPVVYNVQQFEIKEFSRGNFSFKLFIIVPVIVAQNSRLECLLVSICLRVARLIL